MTASKVCALNSPPLRTLKEDQTLAQAFPGQEFIPTPCSPSQPIRLPDLFRKVIAEMPPRQAVVVAVPDQFHYDTVMKALRYNQHVLCRQASGLEFTGRLSKSRS